MIQDVSSAFSTDRSLLKFGPTAIHDCIVADVSPAHAATLPRPVYASTRFWTSKEVYETSYNHRSSEDDQQVAPLVANIFTRPNHTKDQEQEEGHGGRSGLTTSVMTGPIWV